MINKSSKNLYISKAAQKLSGSPALQLLTKAKKLESYGKKIYHFEIGDPDFNTPARISMAAIRSIKNGETHYAPPLGLKELREAIRLETKGSLGFKPDLEQVAVAPAKSFIYFVARCVLNPGEEVIVPDPGFSSYYAVFDFMGVRCIRVPLLERNNFRMSPDDVAKKITPKTRLIIINSPHNPTGSAMTKEEIKKMAQIALKNNIYLLSDEIYDKIIYDRPHYSPAIYDECGKNIILLNSFSKTYAMTGWRLGWIVAPENIIKKISFLIESILSSTPSFIQRAGIEALEGNQSFLKENLAQYRKRRDIMVKLLNQIPGIKCLKPEGAFYVFPNIKATGMTSKQFSDFALSKAGVIVVPGTDFGINGEGYVRMTFTLSMKDIKEGLKKLKLTLS